ncbi:MAG TPA: 16S rRNA (cytosine(1402)-N(4))-methyltransferase RsmH [Patescibacteria group bacterium]|nr:16S rRNA (cytosine(1402)-N(4))-methyltransferase RsmH [Patescibacteria group bacterium]
MHQNKHQNKNNQHEPVLPREVLKYLDPKKGDTYLDLTAGYGGHAMAILEKTGSLRQSVLVDRDQQAISHLKELFSRECKIVNKDYYSATKDLADKNVQFDLILADLGVSSPHLKDGERGFSYITPGPLDMRMDETQEVKASTILNSYSKKEIVKILRDFGEEPKANIIANYIVDSRPIYTTDELARIAKKAWPKYSKKHPATRVFQALRIAVNDELNQLKLSLPIWLELLKPGGRIVVISYHSLEDRIVKQIFLQSSRYKYESNLQLLTKKPISPSPDELEFNPRARSAKLRAAVKIKTKGNSHAY